MEANENAGDKINCFNYSWTRSICLDPTFARRTKMIRKSMTSNFLKTLIVTSTSSYPCPDFIVKVLSVDDQDVEIRHTWNLSGNASLVWSGSVAFYKKWSDLRKAAECIARDFEDIHVVWFPDVINLLIIAERSHKLYNNGVSTVIIKGRRSFEKEEFFNFKKKLSAFGELKRIKFLKGTTEFGKIAVAEYRFVTHAFVAKFHLNGMVYSDMGFLHAEVIMTEKEKSVKKEVVSRFVEHINSLS